MLDVGGTGKDTLEINPLALNVDPHVEKDMNTVQFFLPRCSLEIPLSTECRAPHENTHLLLEHLVIRRQLHCYQRVQVLTALREDIIPPSVDIPLVYLYAINEWSKNIPNETAFILIIN